MRTIGFQALLADRNPTELELQKKEIESLKVENERLNDRIMSFEVNFKCFYLAV